MLFEFLLRLFFGSMFFSKPDVKNGRLLRPGRCQSEALGTKRTVPKVFDNVSIILP